MRYEYRILSIDREEHWLSIASNDDTAYAAPDAFAELLRRIKADIGGEIEEVGDMQFAFTADNLKLTFQWDPAFGIAVLWPEDAPDRLVLSFLGEYMQA